MRGEPYLLKTASMFIETLFNKFLNLLNYYQLTPSEYYGYYGYDFYIPTRIQGNQRLSPTDQLYIDAIEADIAILIGILLDDETNNVEEFKIIYDFAPFFASLGSLRQQRVLNSVLSNLETKGYRIKATGSQPYEYTIKWKLDSFRLFKARP